MRRKLIFVLVVLLSLIIITVWWPINSSRCYSAAFLSSKTQKIQVQASKVVVEPWRGEHHVYGIFMVPDEYKETPLFVFTVKGYGSKCSRPFGYSQNYDDIFAEPGTHLVRHYLRTRIALRLILKGLYFQLNDPQNWTLTYLQLQSKISNLKFPDS